jgi:hypothetical protein
VTLLDLAWFPPLVLAIAVVLGACGSRPDAEIPPTIFHRFVQLLVGLSAVGVVVHSVVLLFA